MNPILTIWTSESTNMLMAKQVALKSNATGRKQFDSINAVEMTSGDLTRALQEKYRNLIDLTAPDSTLHTLAILPLFEEKFADSLQVLKEGKAGSTDSVSLHIIALRGNIARVLGREEGKLPEQKEFENIAILEKEAVGCYSFTIIDDYVESGASLRFTLNSLSEYINGIILSLGYDYYGILHPALLSDNKNIAMGLSCVKFDRKEVINLLMHKSFVCALADAGVDRETVDTQKCLSKATNILSGINLRYDSFYRTYVEPLYKNGQMTDGEIAAAIGEKMEEEFKDIERSLLEFLKDKSLSMPEKEAILALILGRDNPRMQGIQYNQETMLVDDICSSPIETFVSRFNQIPQSDPDHSLLPLRGDYALLKLYEEPDSEGKIKESPENGLAFSPLKRIKELKRQIIDTTAFIRRKTVELEQLNELEKERLDVESNDRRYKRNINPKQAEVKEQPLDEKYEPPVGFKPLQSVDLRGFFSEIRSQGQIGSCTTFAVVSIYESIINRLQKRTAGDKADLSEQFVFHYSNVLAGNPEGGSNYYDQLKVLGTNGICDESLFSYNPDNIGAEPSEAAVEQAAQHRVLKAMQIPLRENGDKIDCINANHYLLTAALSQGYPVGISLKLFDSFEKAGAYINRPDEAELKSGHCEHHAMVLVGYSEQNKCYIVRNSWGTDFGENGYCYISASYVDDPDLNGFCCIITDTTEQATGDEEANTPALVAPFAGTQRQIEIATIRNILDEASVMLSSYQKLYDAYYQYYSQLQQRLALPGTRHALTAQAEQDCARQLCEIEEDKRSRQNSVFSVLQDYAHGLIINATVWSIIAVILICVTFGLVFLSESADKPMSILLVSISAFVTLIAVSLWVDKAMKERKKKRELLEEIEGLAVRENRVRNELLEKRLKLHIAGMWLDNYHKLHTSLERAYNRIISYNGHLQSWMEEDSRAVTNYKLPEGAMFVTLGDKDLLESYFNQNNEQLIRRIDLIDTFRNYFIETETIKQSRERLYKDVRDAIGALFKDFRMYDYVTGIGQYSYIGTLHIADLISRLVNLGQPSCRHSAIAEDSPIYNILIDVRDNERNTLLATIDRHFSTAVSLIPVSDTDTLTLLTIHPVPASSIR